MILESFLLLAFLNPADPGEKTFYPSGVRDDGDYVFSAPPAAIYPILKLSYPIKISPNCTLKAENYAVKPSVDEKKLLLFQGKNVICEFEIVENTLVQEYLAMPMAKIEICGNKVVLKYQIENIYKRAETTLK